MPRPAYLTLFERGELEPRAEETIKLLSPCRVCPRNCGVDRFRDEKGFCRAGRYAEVSSVTPHLGEEPSISGVRGSGTIFFTHCNLRCLYCQNHDISQEGFGEKMDEETLAGKMLQLESEGVHNINWVSPSHYVPQILKALAIACERGLRLPIVYNSGGYDSVEMLRLLDGVVDIYMPDIKYGSDNSAARLSGVGDYVERNREALKEMHRQVGDLELDNKGVAVRGLLVRHLVLPNGLSGTESCLRFLTEEVSKGIYLSLMAQYHPCYKAPEHPELDRGLTRKEYDEAVRIAEKCGVHRGYFQELSSSSVFLPDFKKRRPFK
ncbi:MAG: radical SAM protein [Candidatus Omnitrophica bacterium]|nr:radical SAM protein [Candidatus Omnitrophota bacterium]